MNKREPVIVVFVGNLLTITRLESAAQAAGYAVRVWEAPQPVAPTPVETPPRVGEPLLGPAAQMIEWLTRVRPALIFFDLEWDGAPWREWLAVLTAVPSTRNYPVVCFGPHVQKEALNEARRLGAVSALPRSQFFKDLPTVIAANARRIDAEILETACQGPLSEKGRRGLELFNTAEYFEAHEWLEAAWNEDPSPGRELYRGILQVAVAYFHITRGNYPGAAKLFLRRRQWLDPLPDVCRGVDVQALRLQAEAAFEAMRALGPDHIAQFDRRLLGKVRYDLKSK